MGVLNVTPDSFSDGGRYNGLDTALRHAERMVAEGADLIDIGGESTRPGAPPVSAAEELRPGVAGHRGAATRDAASPSPSIPASGRCRRRRLPPAPMFVNDISGLDL